MTIKRYENNGLRKDGEESVPAICRLQVTERRDEGMNNNSGNDKTMTIHDVARELGVSASTVSRAISGKGRIGAATRDRILDYIEEHGFYPNAAAQSLAQSKTNRHYPAGGQYPCGYAFFPYLYVWRGRSGTGQ